MTCGPGTGVPCPGAEVGAQHGDDPHVAAESSIVAGIAGRYATALFDLAKQRGALDQVEQDLRDLRALLAESDDLRDLVRSPLYGRQAQGRALGAVLARAGVSDLTVRFVGTVAANRRLFALDDMIGGFLGLLARHRGEITAHVISAQPLGQDQVDAVASALAGAVGSKVLLETSVDPALIGGMTVRVGSRMVDGSLRTKLGSLSAAMKGVG